MLGSRRLFAIYRLVFAVRHELYQLERLELLRLDILSEIALAITEILIIRNLILD